MIPAAAFNLKSAASALNTNGGLCGLLINLGVLAGSWNLGPRTGDHFQGYRSFLKRNIVRIDARGRCHPQGALGSGVPRCKRGNVTRNTADVTHWLIYEDRLSDVLSMAMSAANLALLSPRRGDGDITVGVDEARTSDAYISLES